MNWIDNGVTRFLGKVADFMFLNLLWIVCSIPIITIGASTTAMYSVMLKLVKNEEGYIVKGFLKAFKENFRQRTLMWLLYLVFGIVIVVDFMLLRMMSQSIRTVMQVFLIFMTILLISMGIYGFALQARYENRIKNTLKNALILTVAKMPYTLLMLVITVVPVVVTFLTVRTLMLGFLVWLLLGVSLIVWLNSLLLRRVFLVFEDIECNNKCTVISPKSCIDASLYRSNSDHGKPSAGACYALKARVAFYAHKYDVAEAAARKVMGMNVYGLYDNYGDLFQPVAELCNEIIFDREYLENPKNSNEGSYIGQFFAPVMMGGWEALSPTQDLIDSYPCKDGKSIKESPFYNPEDPFADRDPRLGFSVLWNGSQIAGKTFNLNNMGDGSHTRTGYSMKKYINPDNDGINNYDWTNFIYIRYAEVLLTFAEARNENLSAPDTEVYDAVNQIRQRPSVNLPPLPSGLSKDQMREAIRLERRLEFAFEGMHLFDTRSYKTTEKDVTKPVYGVNAKGESIFIETRKFNANRDYLWAIPLEEVDLAQGALKQNPGWD